MARSTSGESVLERAVRILEVCNNQSASPSVSDIAIKAGLPLSTASRLVEELIQHGLLRRDAQRRITMGIRLWELACHASPDRDLREAARPHLEYLHTIVGHDVQLAIRDQSDVVYIDHVAHRDVNMQSQLARRLPLRLTASGLVLLAHARLSTQRSAIPDPGRPDDRIRFIDQRAHAELAHIRRVGHVVRPSPLRQSMADVAVPIRDPRHRVVAALSCTIPDDSYPGQWLPAALSIAGRIQRTLSEVLPVSQKADCN